MQIAIPGNARKRLAIRVAAGLLAMSGVAGAASVHVTSLPSSGVDSAFNKSTSSFMYLEGEASQITGDAFAASASYSGQPSASYAYTNDAAHSFFRTSSSPTTSWSTLSAYDGARYATYGNDSASFTNNNLYWEDLTTNLSAGKYDVFVRAYPTSPGTQTFSLFAGADLNAVNSGTPAATGTTTTTGAAAWLKLGQVDLAPTTDTFRIKIATSTTSIRIDSILFTAVPEPSVLGSVGLCSTLLLRRSAKRV